MCVQYVTEHQRTRLFSSRMAFARIWPCCCTHAASDVQECMYCCILCRKCMCTAEHAVVLVVILLLLLLLLIAPFGQVVAPQAPCHHQHHQHTCKHTRQHNAAHVISHMTGWGACAVVLLLCTLLYGDKNVPGELNHCQLDVVYILTMQSTAAAFIKP